MVRVMANSNIKLLSPDGVTLPTVSNSFKSLWADKRSAPYFSISVVLRGSNVIGGTLSIWVSNSVETLGASYGGPDPGISGSLAVGGALVTPVVPDDAFELGSGVCPSQTITQVGSYTFIPLIPIGTRWVQVQYAATTSAAATTASVYFNGIFSSP